MTIYIMHLTHVKWYLKQEGISFHITNFIYDNSPTSSLHFQHGVETYPKWKNTKYLPECESHTLWCPYTKLVKTPKWKKLYIFLVHVFNQSYVNFKCINLWDCAAIDFFFSPPNFQPSPNGNHPQQDAVKNSYHQ
jgi:hypothetical protein